MVDRETRRNSACTSLSAMAATLLACGGAALIAGAPDWLNHMALAQTPLTGSPDPTFSQDLSGLGHKFELIGTAADAADPRNPTNDVIATTIAEGGSSSDPQFAGAIRPLPPGVDIATLTDQLDLKYFSSIGPAAVERRGSSWRSISTATASRTGTRSVTSAIRRTSPGATWAGGGSKTSPTTYPAGTCRSFSRAG